VVLERVDDEDVVEERSVAETSEPLLLAVGDVLLPLVVEVVMLLLIVIEPDGPGRGRGGGRLAFGRDDTPVPEGGGWWEVHVVFHVGSGKGAVPSTLLVAEADVPEA
jgi:hypothetical protein